jgi:hypothetical protein
LNHDFFGMLAENVLIFCELQIFLIFTKNMQHRVDLQNRTATTTTIIIQHCNGASRDAPLCSERDHLQFYYE